MTHLQQSAVSKTAARPVGLLQGACFALAFGFTVAMVLGVIV